MTNATTIEPPKRIIATGQGATELLLQLGQKDRICGIYYGKQSPTLPELEQHFSTLKVLSQTGPPAKELVLELRPDLVVVQFPTADLDPSRGAASKQDLEQAGASVFPYTATSGNPSIATFDMFLQDVLSLGKLLNAETIATSLIDDARHRISEVKKQISNKPLVNVAIVFSASDQALGVFGSGMLNDLLGMAGAHNVYGDQKDSLLTVSREDFAARSIEYYVIPDFTELPDRRASLSFDWLSKTFPELPASKSHRYVSVAVEKLNVGLRNVEAVEQLAKELHE